MSDYFWRNLIETSLRAKEDDISCSECRSTLDQYVDLLDSGQDPVLILPKLAQHLETCHCCFTEMKALLTAIHAATPSEA